MVDRHEGSYKDLMAKSRPSGCSWARDGRRFEGSAFLPAPTAWLPCVSVCFSLLRLGNREEWSLNGANRCPSHRALGLRRLPTLLAGVAGVLLRPSAFDPSAAGSAESLSFFITKFQSHCGHRFAQAGFRGAGGAVWAVLSLPGLLSVRSLHTRRPCGTSTRWQFCRLEIARFPLPRPQSAMRRQKHHHLLFSLNSVQLLKQQRIQGAPRSGVSKHFL